MPFIGVATKHSQADFLNASSRSSRITLWVATVLLALPILAAGLPKLLGLGAWVGLFAHYGYPVWLVPVVGIAEVCGVVLLFVPRFVSVGATMIAVVMAAAAATHAMHHESSRVVMTAMNFALASIIAWARWPRLRAR